MGFGLGTGHSGITSRRVVYGRGTVDLNSGNNAEPSGLVKNINATVLVHGRVRNAVSIEGITMMNTMRSVMLYGEHTGKFLQGGAVGPESFDAENISIFHTRRINRRGSGYLW